MKNWWCALNFNPKPKPVATINGQNTVATKKEREKGGLKVV